MKKDENQIEKSNNDYNPSFWKHNNAISIVTIILLVSPIFLFYKFGMDPKSGFNSANAIALFTASVAISGIFYSNYRNDIRNQKQIIEAEKRLEKQLKKQDKQLTDQLEHSETQLEKQLIFDKERDVMLEIYNILFENRGSLLSEIEDIDTVYWISKKRNIIYSDLLSIQKDIKQFYYIPNELRTIILDFIKHISKKMDDPYYLFAPENNSYDTYKLIYFDDKKVEPCLKEIYTRVEDYFEIPIKR